MGKVKVQMCIRDSSVTQSKQRGLFRVIDELRKDGSPVAENIADHIESMTDYDFAHLDVYKRQAVLPYGKWLAPYPNGNHAGKISRPAPTLGKETGNRLVL